VNYKSKQFHKLEDQIYSPSIPLIVYILRHSNRDEGSPNPDLSSHRKQRARHNLNLAFTMKVQSTKTGDFPKYIFPKNT